MCREDLGKFNWSNQSLIDVRTASSHPGSLKLMDPEQQKPLFSDCPFASTELSKLKRINFFLIKIIKRIIIKIFIINLIFILNFYNKKKTIKW